MAIVKTYTLLVPSVAKMLESGKRERGVDMVNTHTLLVANILEIGKRINFGGQGTLTHENGNVYSGEWENDEPVQGRFTRNGRPWHGSVKDVKIGR